MQTNFFGNLAPQTDMQSLYKTRRKELITAIQQKYAGKAGAVLLFAAFETGSERFRQDKTFYYYSNKMSATIEETEQQVLQCTDHVLDAYSTELIVTKL